MIEIKTRYYILALIYSLFEKKRQFCKDCIYSKFIYCEQDGYLIDIDCIHPLKQSAHKPVKMENFRCKGFKKYKK